MEKKNKKHLKFLFALFLFSNTGFTQAKSGIENYNFLGQGQDYVWMPIFHYEAKKGLYAEVRYNYEDAQTLSFFGGKKFAGGKSIQYSITPMLGYSIGTFSGISLAANAEVEWKSFYLSSQTQYSIANKNSAVDFFFNWSELAYNISDNFFGGVAIQYTLQQGISDVEPGFVGGINFKNFSMPFYAFSPFKSNRYFILGLNFESSFKKKK